MSCSSTYSQKQTKLDSAFNYNFVVLDSVSHGIKSRSRLTNKETEFIVTEAAGKEDLDRISPIFIFFIHTYLKSLRFIHNPLPTKIIHAIFLLLNTRDNAQDKSYK
jgi:hypothetical protein